MLTVITEWDDDYKAKAPETKIPGTKTLGTKVSPNTEPQRTAAQTLGLGVATYQHNQLRSHASLEAPQFRGRDNRPVNHSGPPSFSNTNGLAPRAQEWKENQVPAWTTKKFTDSNKSKQGWAEHPGLITTRKGNQIALDAASNKYLGPIPENTSFKCTVIVTIINTRLKLTHPGVFRPL